MECFFFFFRPKKALQVLVFKFCKYIILVSSGMSDRTAFIEDIAPIIVLWRIFSIMSENNANMLDNEVDYFVERHFV